MAYMRKKYIVYGLVFIVLAAVFFGGGIFLAQRKIKAEKIILPSRVSIDLSQKNPENETIGGNTAPAGESNSGNTGENNNDENAGQAADQAENKFVFGILGDTQRFSSGNPSGGLQKAVKYMSEKNVDLVMTEGDLLSSCGGDCESKLMAWKNVLGALFPKTYELMGNHDRTDREKSDAVWQKVFSLPTNGPAGYSELAYSFDFKNSHFAVLDSEKPNEGIVNDTQRAWLEQDLGKNKKENTFVFFHEPAWPVNSKIGESLDAKPKERDALWGILVSHNVTAVFNGHEHIASRRKIGNLYQFVFGNTDSFNHEAPKPGMAEYGYVGQSFGIVEVNGKEIAVNTYSTDGKLLDSFKLIK
jgi:3',5'-cyclic-AMP phosphodiesterase